jgi:VanZ family protein
MRNPDRPGEVLWVGRRFLKCWTLWAGQTGGKNLLFYGQRTEQAGMISRQDGRYRRRRGWMPQRLLLTMAAWAGMCLIVYATLCPLRDRPTLPISSNLEHLATFVVFGALFCLAYPRRTFTVLIFVIGSGALLEILQLLTPDRHARTLDALQKIAGGAAGVLVGRAILYLDRARSWFQV